MSLFGIAGASASDVGTAQTQYGDNHTVEEITKVDAKQLKVVKKSIKKHKNVVKGLKRIKKTASSKKVTTRKVNKSKSATKQAAAKKYKYKKYTYKKWYKYHGKWRYKTVYKYKKSNSKYQKVTAGSNTTVKSNYNQDKSVNNSSDEEKAAAGSKKKVKSSKSANSSSVKSLAKSLTKGTRSQYQKGSNVFKWVRNNVKYSFYYNTKYGASGTLKYRKGNCADQSHLVVALARSSGLKARYVHGKVRFSSGKVYGHVWAQVYANGKWYTADATSSRNSFGKMTAKVVKLKGVYNKLPF